MRKSSRDVLSPTLPSSQLQPVAVTLKPFSHQGRWYVGKIGTGPVLYESCPSAELPANWSTYTWKGVTSPLPAPHLTASPGAQPL